MSDAFRPADYINPYGLGYSCRGFIGQARSNYFEDGFFGYEKKTKSTTGRFSSLTRHVSTGSNVGVNLSIVNYRLIGF